MKTMRIYRVSFPGTGNSATKKGLKAAKQEAANVKGKLVWFIGCDEALYGYDTRKDAYRDSTGDHASAIIAAEEGSWRSC